MKIRINLHDKNVLDKVRRKIINYVVDNTKTQTEASRILGIKPRTLRNYNKKNKEFNMKTFIDCVRRFLNCCKDISAGTYVKRNVDDKTYKELKQHRIKHKRKLRSMVLDTNQEVRENLEDIGSIVEKVKKDVELTEIESAFCQILYINDLIDGAGNFTQKGKHELLN